MFSFLQICFTLQLGEFDQKKKHYYEHQIRKKKQKKTREKQISFRVPYSQKIITRKSL